MITQLNRAASMLIFATTSAFAWGAEAAPHKIANGTNVFYGVVPSKVGQDHVKQHGAQSMHGKTRLARRTHHLVVSLYDAKSAERITSATDSSTLTPLGLNQQTKTLYVMKTNDAISYGNYFNMPPDDIPYRITLSIKRPTDHSPSSGRL